LHLKPVNNVENPESPHEQQHRQCRQGVRRGAFNWDAWRTHSFFPGTRSAEVEKGVDHEDRDGVEEQAHEEGAEGVAPRCANAPIQHNPRDGVEDKEGDDPRIA
jgi:hypothetical protein